MHQYLRRWMVAVLVVAPIMFLLIPIAHRLFFSVEGPHAADSLWSDFLNMAGFYAGFAFIAGTVTSLVHTWLVRRRPRMGIPTQLTYATLLGIASLLPQAALFGRGYWGINFVAGAAAGLIYGLFVTLVPPRGRPASGTGRDGGGG